MKTNLNFVICVVIIITIILLFVFGKCKINCSKYSGFSHTQDSGSAMPVKVCYPVLVQREQIKGYTCKPGYHISEKWVCDSSTNLCHSECCNYT